MAELSTLPPLEEVIHSHGLMARKALGQHFLLDGSITDNIARYGGDLSKTNVIEIGPGPGGLTRSLLKAGAKKLFVIEKDDRCLDALGQIKDIVGERLKIIHGDALETDLVDTIPAPRRIIANLPYNAATPMLIGWLDAIYQHGPSAFESLTLMFQKEVADRITAEPRTPDYGRLTIISQFLCDCRHDMDLPPKAFYPPPKVTSTVVTLTPRQKPLVDVRKEVLEQVMIKAFGQRRKMLRQSLKGLAVTPEILLKEAGIAGTHRAEELDVVALCRLAQTYQKINCS